MKRIFLSVSFTTAFILTGFLLNAQTLVNKSWQDTTGNPHDTMSLLLGETDGSSNFVIVGNTWPTSDSELVLITKMTTSGTVIWQSRLASTSTKRIIATDLDISNGYIYITGTGYDSVNSKSTFATEKISDSTGATIWTEKYTPSYTGYAVAGAIREDNAGNVYVSGTEQTGSTNYEMTFLKYNSSGTLQWTTHYDSSGLYSGAVGMGTVASDSLFPVSGYSGSAFGTWDIVSMQVNAYTGAVSSVSRVHNGSGSFISHPVAVAKDTKGDTYIVGASEVSGPNIDIKLTKYDSLFNQTWIRTWGGADSLDDEPTSMVIDTNGYLVITGYTSHAGGKIDFLTVRYDKNGNLKWNKTFNSSNPSGTVIAQGASVTADGLGNIFATGKVFMGSNYAIATLAYDTGGNVLWQQVNADNGSDDIGMNISLDAANDVYVSGTTGTGGSQKYITMLYKQWKPSLCSKANEFPDTVSVAVCPTITYTFRNGHTTTAGSDTFVEFDIYAKTSIEGTPYEGGLIYFTYSDSTFGNNVVTNGDITVTSGTVTTDTTYHFALKDTLLKSEVVQSHCGEVQLLITGSNSGRLYHLSDTAKQLLHIKMQRTKERECKMLFDKFFMQNQSLFYNGANTPYIYVNTGGPLGQTNSDCGTDAVTITYGLTELPNAITYTGGNGVVTFNVTANPSQDLYYGTGVIFLNTGADIIASAIVANGVLSDTIYGVGISTPGSTTTIPITNGTSIYNAFLPGGVATVLFSVKLTFDLSGCQGESLGISFNDSTTTSDNALSTQYFDDSLVSLFSFCSVSDDGSTIDDQRCPPPTITDISSSAGCVTAGSFDEITITGNNFVNASVGVAPIVYFDNADFGDAGISHYVTTLPNDILSYSQTQIVLLIPSIAPRYNDAGPPGTAGSGDVLVIAPDQQSNATPYSLYIHFANNNVRGDGTRGVSPTSIGDYNNPLFLYFPIANLTTQWMLDSALFARAGALYAATKMVSDINCNLGTSYTVNQTTGFSEPISSYNATSTGISVLPSSSGAFGPGVVAETKIFFYPNCSFPGASSPTIDNPTGMSVNALKSCYIELCDDGTLGHSGSTLPNGKHWWFDATTNPTASTYDDFAGTVLHELGHTALLSHSNNFDTITRVMYWTLPTYPHVRRTFADDADDIQGALHMFTLGNQLGSMCVAQAPLNNDSAATPYFSSFCTAPSLGCGALLVQGLKDVHPVTALNASLYPNPTQGNATVHIDISDNENISIQVFDLLGQPVSFQRLTASKPIDVTLDMTKLAAAIYVVQIVANNGASQATKSLKLIKTE